MNFFGFQSVYAHSNSFKVIGDQKEFLTNFCVYKTCFVKLKITHKDI